MTAVAAGNERGLADVEAAVCTLEPREDAIGAFLKSDELSVPLDRDSSVAQPLNQQPLVFVLREDERIGVRANARAHRSEHRARNPAARDPRLAAGRLRATRNSAIRQTDLTVELERAGLHGDGARRRRRRRCLVDNPDLNAQACEPQRQNQTGWAGSDNQHLGWVPRAPVPRF